MAESRFRFRAWDKKYKKMYVGDIKIALAFPDDDVVIMQSTGLTDCNGKLIFEGDILRWLGHSEPITVDARHGYRFMFGKDQLCRAYGNEGEVIGNVYETELGQGG